MPDLVGVADHILYEDAVRPFVVIDQVDLDHGDAGVFRVVRLDIFEVGLVTLDLTDFAQRVEDA